MQRTKRRVVKVDTSQLAQRIGTRLRAARVSSGLTQQALAGDRYTKAYISALENGLARPSMAALDYLAPRLGTTSSRLLADDVPAWTRLEADLELAAGRWATALDAYEAILEKDPGREARAELLRGSAEALVRLDRGSEATARAAEAVELFEGQGRAPDAALASYWLAAGLYQQDSTAEARSVLQAVLASVRAGLRVEPDFKLRLLMALSSVESRDGNHEVALSYLEEVRALSGELDDRRRASFLFDLAYSDRETGDYEAAIRHGHASLALFRASDSMADMAALENDLALAHLATGRIGQARELAERAHGRFRQLGDERMLAHVIETQAQIAGAEGDWPTALRLAEESRQRADDSGNRKAAANALVSAARAHAALGDGEKAHSAYERAADEARSMNNRALLRHVLTDWAEFLARTGEHEAAYALTREALRS